MDGNMQSNAICHLHIAEEAVFAGVTRGGLEELARHGALDREQQGGQALA